MDFSAQLDQLQQRAAQAKQAAQAAASESREQRRQRIDQAKVDVDQAAKDAQQEQSAAAASARGKWAQLKADAAAKMDKRADQLDARIAANQADGPRPTPRTPSTLPPGRWTACGWRCWDAIDAPPTPTSSSGQRAPSLHRRHRATTTV